MRCSTKQPLVNGGTGALAAAPPSPAPPKGPEGGSPAAQPGAGAGPSSMRGLDTVVYAYVVEDEPAEAGGGGGGAASPGPPSSESPARARYTKGTLRQALQLMGCKPRLAHKAAEKVFHVLQQRASLHGGGQAQAQPQPQAQALLSGMQRLRPGFACVSLPRSQFRRLVTDCLAADDEALREQHLQDFAVACR